MKYQGKHLSKKRTKNWPKHKGRSRTRRESLTREEKAKRKASYIVGSLCLLTLVGVPVIGGGCESAVPSATPEQIVVHTPEVPPEHNEAVQKPAETASVITNDMIYELCHGEQLLTPDDLSIWPTIQKEVDGWVSYVSGNGETLPFTLGKIVTEEIGGLTEATAYSTPEQERAAVVWTICNRTDLHADATSVDMVNVATSPNQFAYYTGTIPYEGTQEIAVDVICRWVLEDYVVGVSADESAEIVGRVLAQDYIYFGGDGAHNHFRKDYEVSSPKWQWEYSDPYVEVE